MTIGSVLLGVALLIVVGLYVTRPIFARDPQRRRRMSERKALMLQKEAILTEVRALDFDFETGRVAEEEYQQQREAYVAEAAELLARIDALEDRFLADAVPASAVTSAGDVAPAQEGQSEAVVDEIEAAIARRRAKAAPTAAAPVQEAPVVARRAKNGGFCPQCGQPADAGDRFCAYCGHQLAQPQHA